MKRFIKILLIVLCVASVVPIFAQKIDDFSDEERDFFSNTKGTSSAGQSPSDSTFPIDEPEPGVEFPSETVEVPTEPDFEEPAEEFADIAEEAPNFETNEDLDFEEFDDESTVENEI